MPDKEKILVVDDEPSIRKYLQTLLEVDGYEVEAVSSGQEALERLGSEAKPDLVILDVLMPELNGLDTLRQIMEIDRSTHVIMLSCSNEVGTVVEAIRLGAQDYLTKPFEKAELDVAMLKCRQKKELRSENKALREYCDQLTEDIILFGGQPSDGSHPATNSPDCTGGCARVHLRRKRRRKRSDRAHDSHAVDTQKFAVH